jgi:hypothetical protein
MSMRDCPAIYLGPFAQPHAVSCYLVSTGTFLIAVATSTSNAFC